MKKLVQKDKISRNIVNIYETKKFILKSLFSNTNFSKLIRWKAYSEMNMLPLKSSQVRVTNRCVITGRKKRINSLHSFSRISFLKLARFGRVCGLKKSSW